MSLHKKYYIVLIQLFLLSITATIFIFIAGWMGFRSVFLGGIAWIIPTVFFLWRLRRRCSYNAQEIVGYFFVSEAIKLLLSFILVIFILLMYSVDKVSFLVGYITMILTSSIFLMCGVKNGSSVTPN